MEGLSYCDNCEESMPQDEYLKFKGLCDDCIKLINYNH